MNTLSKHKIMLAFGTRPEAIKLAPLYHSLKSDLVESDVYVCVTGQHRHMLDQVLRVFDIVPDIDLDLMKDGQDLFDITSSVLLSMREVLEEYKPDLLIVHGDTTTSMASALAAFYSGVPVGHVEAGLRTHDVFSPYPEEFNRQIVSKLAQLHFAPTEMARENLLKERVQDSQVSVTGNTVIDALFWVLNRIDSDAVKFSEVTKTLDYRVPFDWQNERFILVTGHRRENFGTKLVQICKAISELACDYPHVHFVYPVHLNPNVQQPVSSILSQIDNVHLIAPLDYEPFVYLLKRSYIVLTDSGGIQEEAPSLGKPVLVMRDVTERPEAIEAGTARLVGASRRRIIAQISELLDNTESYNCMAVARNPYGDGKACGRIIHRLKKFLQ
jgi:UDP-N-acetylglucosamine 2-epimerase (non-hydrolysing)